TGRDVAGGGLHPGRVGAIEPFVPAGRGVVAEHGPPEFSRLDPRREPPDAAEPEVLEAMRAFRGLPFSRRQLAAHAGPRLEALLRRLQHEKRLMAYAPLRETSGHRVAQAEHTAYLGPSRGQVLP